MTEFEIIMISAGEENFSRRKRKEIIMFKPVNEDMRTIIAFYEWLGKQLEEIKKDDISNIPLFKSLPPESFNRQAVFVTGTNYIGTETFAKKFAKWTGGYYYTELNCSIKEAVEDAARHVVPIIYIVQRNLKSNEIPYASFIFNVQEIDGKYYVRAGKCRYFTDENYYKI